MKKSFFVLFLLLAVMISPLRALEISGDINWCHDPSTIIYADSKYWNFSTNNNLNCRTSTNLTTWTWGSQPFSYSNGVPDYMADILSTCEGIGPWNLWAPDIIKIGSLYYLYYSRDMCVDDADVEQTVCGLAIGSSLTNRDWVDQGPVLLSDLDADYRRNIDPTLLLDSGGNLWMAVGSYGYPDGNGWTYGGIWLYQMDTETGLVKSGTSPTQLARAWIEAPCLYYKNGYYYLFFNQQTCCLGTSSKYYIRYGRSSTINGTYYDKDGNSLLTQNTGGSLFLGRDYFANYDDGSGGAAYDYLGSLGDEIGPGHFAYFTAQDGVERFSFHFYNASNSGIDALAIRTLIWGDDGWPRAGWNLADGNYAITCGMNRDAGAPSGGLFMEIPHGYSDVPQMWGWNGGLNQIWSFTRTAANKYKILNLSTGKALAIVSGVVKLVNYSSTNNAHHWYVEQINNRAFKILNVSTGKALEVYNGSNTAGAAMSAGTWNTSQISRQCFWLTSAGVYNIRNQYGSMVARVANSSTSTRLTTTAWTGANYQKWRFIPTWDGYTKMVNVGSGLVADLYNGSVADGTRIQQYSDLDNDAQRWGIERLCDGTFRILNKANGKAWRVSALTSGAYVNQYRWYHTLDQQWTFELQSASPYARTWTGGGSTVNWSDTGNWDIPSYPPDTLQFSGTTNLTSTNNLTAGYQVSAINFVGGAGAFTLSGNRIGLLGDVVNLSTNLQTINLPIELLESKLYYFAATTGSMDIAGTISGAGSLVKNGSYTLTLSGANSYSGSTQVLAGTAKMGTDNVLPSTTALTVSSGAALDLNGTDQTVASLTNSGSITNTSCMRAVLTVTSTSQTIILPGSNMEDLVAIAGQWLHTSCVTPDWCDGADRDRSGTVNLADYEDLASSWLDCD